MTKSKFILQLEKQWAENKFVCVGLDSDYSQIPAKIKNAHSTAEAIFTFNRQIVDVTCDLVGSYKLNSAFYEAEGIEGISALKETIIYIKQKNSQLPVILDAKRGDIGNTNAAYAKFVFEYLGADAVTVNPYQGKEALQPFLDYIDKGIIILVKTSNPGSGEFQDLLVEGTPLYQVVAKNVAETWNQNGNCGIVVGATYPDELQKIREIVGDLPILIPGIGAQGGELQGTIKSGKDSRGWGMLIHSARGIIFAEDPRAATLKLHQEIVHSTQMSS